MAIDPYASCPCGSGKKFKWCCQPIYPGIERAFEQEAQGQHEAALKGMDEVIAQHADNPEVYGRKAELLYTHGRVEEAEEVLQKAFALNPNYPYGLLLQATFRFQEGEIPGALLLARKAADAFHPESHDHLAHLYSMIFECEMRMNRPVAGRAALKLVTTNQPASAEARDSMEAVFGADSRLPACARADYSLLPTRQKPAVELSGGVRMSELARAYEKLTTETADDPAAWFNLGVARAWLGDNRAALDALDRYLPLETDDARISTAAALAEVLRCGAGLENESDYREYVLSVQIRDPQTVIGLLREWDQERRIIPVQAPEGAFQCVLIETSPTGLVTVGKPAADSGRLAGYVFATGSFLRAWGPIKEPIDRLKDELRQRLQLSLNELRERVEPIQFSDVAADALIFPLGVKNQEEAAAKVKAHAEKFYEDGWVHRPRKVLAGNSPLDAVGHPVLRKKLLGVVQFVQDCAAGGSVGDYDFSRLRRKLGLSAGSSAPSTASSVSGASGPDVAAMGAAELAALAVDGLSDAQVEQAYQAAQKLDAGELAANFARTLVGRPASAERPDRFPFFSFLTQHALREGNTDEALRLLDDAERQDAACNEGKRRDDYALRRAQVHVKRGEAEKVEEVFAQLIERSPAELRFRTSAAEAMLSLRKGDKALRFAEEGLLVARSQQNRDAEHHLQELAGAARKQIG